MKRGKKSLLYIFSIVFCCLFMLFFVSEKIEAASFSYTYIDEGDRSYYRLDKIAVSDGEVETLTEISVPNVYDDGTNGEKNVEVIGSNVIQSNRKLNLTSLVLPSNLKVISESAFTNIASLTELRIPTSVEVIEANLFEDDNNEDTIINVYLDDYKYHLDYALPDGSTFEYTDIDSNAFTNATRIICGSYTVYNFFGNNEQSSLKDASNLTAIVKYQFYKYQNETLTSDEDKFGEEIIYYIGEEIGYLPDSTSITPLGLNFKNWRIKISENNYVSLSVNSEVYYSTSDGDTFNVYPLFELRPLSFSVISTSGNQSTSIAQYNGGEDVIKLQIKDETHELILNSDFKKESIKWYKVDSDKYLEKFDDLDVLNFKNVVDKGTYKCIITYKYVYQGTPYEVSANNIITIDIKKAPLHVVVEDVTKTYGEYLDKNDIEYDVIGLLGSDSVESYSFDYPTDPANVGKYINAIKVVDVTLNTVELDGEDIHNNTNYDIAYSYGDYIVTPIIVDAVFDGVNYGKDISYGDYSVKSEVKVVCYKEENGELVEELCDADFDEINSTINVTYGDKITILSTYTYNNIYGNPESLTVYFFKETGNTVRECENGITCGYGITGIKNISSDNYVANFDSTNTNGEIIINTRKVEMEIEKNSVIYDGNSKEVNIFYKDVNDMKIYVPFTIEYKNKVVTEIVNAGEYKFSIDSTGDKNYDFANDSYKTLYFNVEKATPRILEFEDQTYTYTGSRIDPRIVIDNSEQTPVFHCQIGYNTESCTDQGVYGVYVTLDESDNYTEYRSPSITLTISKLMINLTPKDFTFYYGEEIELKEEVVINGEKVLLKYETNATSESKVGTYYINRVHVRDIYDVKDHNNYMGSLIASECLEKVKIVKRPVSIVYYNYTNLVYNGRERSIGAYAVDDLSGNVIDDLKLTVVCDEGIIKDAKTYHLRTYFDSNYYEAKNSNLLVFNIEKATYDVSNIVFNSKKFTLNFKRHGIEIEGELPEGVSVVYSIDGKEGNTAVSGFNHTVVARFIGDSQNYMPIDNLEATIHIDMTWFFVAMSIFIGLMGVGVCLVLLYAKYRREHPKKIKLKIRNMVKEDLAAKRVATSVKEVLGDEEVEHENLENEDDLIEDGVQESFIDKIYAADSEIKYYYSEVKNELLSYEGITCSIDRKYEVFHHGTRQVAKLSICNNVLRLYVNLDPDRYDKKQYNHRDMSKFETHARTPLRINVDTTESLRHAKVFIRILRKKENLKTVTSFVRIDYEKFYTLKENIFPKLFKKMFASNKQKNKK